VGSLCLPGSLINKDRYFQQLSTFLFHSFSLCVRTGKQCCVFVQS
jgi:hypothetical protein